MKKPLELKPLFLERMQELLPDKEDFQNYLNCLKKESLTSIRCNTIKISPENLKKRLEEKNWKIKQPWKNYPEVMLVEGKFVNKFLNDEFDTKRINENLEDNFNINSKGFTLTSNNQSVSNNERNLIDLEPGELGRSLEHLLGYYYVQDLASMLSVIALEPKQNEFVLDLCASPGSKTTQTASLMQNTGTIIANEISLGRIKILASNLERCGVTNCIITKKEGSALCNRLKKQNSLFDKILIDAPCSGEGTLKSNPKTAIMWNIKTVKALPRIQKNLVSSAIEILKPKGILVYSTCTHAPEENEEVVDEILNKFKDKIKLEKINLPVKYREGVALWENKVFSNETKKCARIYPQDNDTEGFFIAKFRRMR